MGSAGRFLNLQNRLGFTAALAEQLAKRLGAHGDRAGELRGLLASADANPGTFLVAAAEALGLTRVFTLDRDFQIYRWRGKRKFEVIP